MTLDDIRIVAVLGAGTMGNGIAHVFARSGYDVILRDIDQHYLDRALEKISSNLDREIRKGKFAAEEKPKIVGRIRRSPIWPQLPRLISQSKLCRSASILNAMCCRKQQASCAPPPFSPRTPRLSRSLL